MRLQMDKSNFLADDFQQIARKSDDAVYELIKQKEREKSKGARSSKADQQNPRPKIKREVKRPQADVAKVTASKPETKSKREHPVEPPKEWGRPVAILNTRIPQELSDLIDDLVYRSKKSGTPTTKQAITIEALKELVLKQL